MSDQKQHSNLQHIPAERVAPGQNDRQVFTGLNDLAASIQNNGLLENLAPLYRPVPVTEDYVARYAVLHGHTDLPADGPMYEIVAGERRTRAMVQVLGWQTIPCLVQELSDEEAAAIMLAENTARKDLNPIEEGHAYRQRAEHHGWSVSEIADKAGVNTRRVQDRMKLLELCADVQRVIGQGHFPIGHGLLMVDLDINRQRIALRIYNESASMPRSRFEQVVKELHDAQVKEAQTPLFALEAYAELVIQEQSCSSSGKKAQTGAPTNPELPPVRVKMSDSVGGVLDRYIADLLAAGKHAEAAAVGNLYNALVSYNWTSVPGDACLDITTTAPVGNAHSQVIK